jgi:hypothetical protein
VYRRAAYGRQANSHALFKALLLAAFAIHTKSVLWKRLRRTFGLAAPPQHCNFSHARLAQFSIKWPSV